ncbi:MAG: LLM class flavin-dependent oxidoreductase [Actinomycetota bacterium]|nr:LLM class flavin-dependent oxidoreductase [Actinomycetota bacterium]
MTTEFHLFLPQMRMTPDVLAARAQAAEAAGFHGIALMDHLWAPMAEHQAAYEAMVTATFLAARTTTLTISHLVLCDSFRHPVQLAKEAITLDHVSGGRFELGIGWGSVPTELDATGIGAQPKVRVARLRESLELLRAAFAGEALDHDGEHFTVHAPPLAPTPLDRIPIVIGGAGPRTLELAEYADWWNVPIYALHKLGAIRDQVGVPVSTQQMVTLVRPDHDRAEVEALVEKRFRGMRPIVGDAAELTAHYEEQVAAGVSRFYVWLSDFAEPATLEHFGAEIITRLAPTGS